MIKILDLLSDKPNDYEKEFEQNLYREDSYFELIALANQFLDTLDKNTWQAYAASSPVPVVSNSSNNFRTNLPKVIIKQFDMRHSKLANVLGSVLFIRSC